MASTIPVTCPECEKQFNAPADAAGKKIRCKNCGHAFMVKGPSGKKSSPDKKEPDKKAVQAKPKPKAKDTGGEEEENANPYGLTDSTMVARCPHCAAELQNEDDIICLSCGYNTITRQRHGTKMTKDRTAGDWAAWLAPGILCVILALICGGSDLTYIFWLGRYIDYKAFGDDTSCFGHACFKVWFSILAAFFVFYTGRFAFRRLVLHPTPPEQEIKMKKKEE